MSSEDQRVLFWLKYRFIGDAVLTTPLLHAVASKYKTPDVLTARHLQPLLMGEPGIRLVENPKVKAASDFFRQVAWLRRQRYDLAIIVNRSFRSALAARLAGIRRRVGFPTEGRGFLLTDRVPYDPIGFEGGCYSRLGDPLGLDVPSHPPKLTLSEAERELGGHWSKGAVVGIQPGASVPQRALPTEHAALIANALAADGNRIALFGGEAERPAADALLPLIESPPVDLIGKCSLRETMCALSGLRVYVAADSGLVHVSAGLGVPTVTTFSLTPAAKWGHNYSPHKVFTAPEGDMARMDADAVLAAAREQLGVTRRP